VKMAEGFDISREPEGRRALRRFEQGRLAVAKFVSMGLRGFLGDREEIGLVSLFLVFETVYNLGVLGWHVYGDSQRWRRIH